MSTDKVDTEVPAPASGVLLKIYISEGETVDRGTLLAVIGQAGEAVDDKAPPVGATHGSSQPATADNHLAETQPVNSGRNGYSGHVTPVVARMVSEYNIDLSKVKGTGRGGRITKKDVEAYLAQRETAPEAVAEEVPPWEQPVDGDLFKPTVEYDVEVTQEARPVGTRYVPPEVTEPPPRLHPVEPIPQAADGELVALTPMRKNIAEHMLRSKHTSPHVTTVFEVDMSAVLAHREANKDAFAKNGVNLTLTAYFVAAVVDGLRAVPTLNAQWTDEGIYLHRPMNIGIAVALDGGLIVPVIKNAQDLNLMGIARAVNDLATRARNKQLKPDEVQGGTFSITNHGVSGSLFATPIINQPQAGILGVGVMEKRVKVITDANGNDMIAIRPCVYVSLTFDHRIADGATADGFLLTLKQRLEGWKD
ncbi:MAG TPA: dihydrolipoamide acetyltransferase family protein [Oceanobacillus sp.]|nr:dihydrolipoamide acetyltransferase family protein [Oceanobacillus sp.]